MGICCSQVPYHVRGFANMSDMDFKERGNRFYNQRKYEEAIQCYTSAIRKNPSNPFFFTNRAISQFKMSRFDLVVSDCRTALDLDPTIVKGHYFLGQALCELESLDEGIMHIQRAIDLSKEQRQNYGDELTQILRHWRKRRFAIAEEKRLCEEIELQNYLTELVRKDQESKVQEAKSEMSRKGITDPKEVEESLTHIKRTFDGTVAEVNGLFAKVDERRRTREVPDYLCGKISFEILRDPVVTPSGITYERKDIEEHLLRVGHFDPVTRLALTADQLTPNYAMKEVVDSFIAENEWALDF